MPDLKLGFIYRMTAQGRKQPFEGEFQLIKPESRERSYGN